MNARSKTFGGVIVLTHTVASAAGSWAVYLGLRAKLARSVPEAYLVDIDAVSSAFLWMIGLAPVLLLWGAAYRRIAREPEPFTMPILLMVAGAGNWLFLQFCSFTITVLPTRLYDCGDGGGSADDPYGMWATCIGIDPAWSILLVLTSAICLVGGLLLARQSAPLGDGQKA